jgi:hypothetical protein
MWSWANAAFLLEASCARLRLCCEQEIHGKCTLGIGVGRGCAQSLELSDVRIIFFDLLLLAPNTVPPMIKATEYGVETLHVRP